MGSSARLLLAASAAALLGGCGELRELLPPEQDGGQVKVPGTYLDARISPGHRAHLALSGDQQLSCHDCHRVADAGFSGQAVVPCATCHQRQQEHHHPFDGGVAMGCQSCHAFRGVGEAALIDKWGCRRCHVAPLDGGTARGPALDAPNPLHLPPQVAVHTQRCEACHRPHGTPFTLAADCGRCHDLRVSHGKGEKALVADTCMTCHPHHSEAKVAQVKCASCHVGGPVPAKAQVKPAALFEKGHDTCATCHKPHAFVASQVRACTECHVAKPVLAQQKHAECNSCHRPHEARAAAKTCEGCHTKVHVKHPVDTAGRPCLGCHPIHAPEASLGVPVPQTATAAARLSLLAVPCTRCHASAPFSSSPVHAKGLECLSCHRAAHDGKPKREPLCASCHAEEQKLTRRLPGHQDCGGCHAGLPHGAPETPKPCLSCHPAKQPPQRGHAEQLQCQTCHQTHSGGVLITCTKCHNTPEKPLPGLHRLPKHQSCATCHAPHGPQPGLEPRTCRSCHGTLSAKSHPTPPKQCASCHLFTEVKP